MKINIIKYLCFSLIVIYFSFGNGFSQTRFSASGGMGIDFQNFYKLNDYLSYYWGYSNSRGDLKSLIDFYADFGYDFSEKYSSTLDLSYSIGSFTNNYGLGNHQLDINLFQPNLIITRYWQTDFYRISVGGGGGYYLLSFNEKLPNQVEVTKSSTTGFGIIAVISADTYLSRNLFISLTGELRLMYFKESDFKRYSGNTFTIGKINFDSRGATLKIGLKYFFNL